MLLIYIGGILLIRYIGNIIISADRYRCADTSVELYSLHYFWRSAERVAGTKPELTLNTALSLDYLDLNHIDG